jgi:hypothetical protein
LLIRKAALLAAAATAVVCAGVRVSRSQVVWFVPTYEPSIAVGDAGDFVTNPGYVGVGGELRTFRGKRLAWSLSGSWQNMYETTDEIVHIENVTISGTQVRYLDFVPLLIGADYHFLGRERRIRPFVGLAAGTYWVRQRVKIGTVDIELNKNWHFGLAPQLGITFLTPDPDFYGFIGSDFNYIFSRKDSIDYMYVTLSLGFVYLL